MEQRFLSPAQAAAFVSESGLRVLSQPFAKTLVLSLLAGVYIGFGAQLSTVVTQDAQAHLGLGLSRFLGGSVFSLGLMLIVICGAELFTGNSLLTKTALERKISWGAIARNWTLVILGNLAGSLFFAALMFYSDLWRTGNLEQQALAIAGAKVQIPFGAALIRGILCNWLVCLAVFMAAAARDIAGKILACYVPIMAFVASGFEHSVANMYFIPTGLFINEATGSKLPHLDWAGFWHNLIPVTLGNVLGGVVFVGCAYWFVHLHGRKSTAN